MGQAELLEDFDSLIRYADPTTRESSRAVFHGDVDVHLKTEDGSASEWQASCLVLVEDSAAPATAGSDA